MWEIIGNNTSEIIALSAFILAAYQLYLSRKSSRLSVIPHIAHYASTTRNNGSAIYEFTIANTGMGPAKLTEWQLLFDGQDIEKSEYQVIDNYLNYLCAGKKSSITVGNLSEDHMIASGEQFKVLRVQVNIEKQIEFYDLEKSLDRLDLRVKYQSVYGDKYLLSTQVKANKLSQQDAVSGAAA